MVIENRVRPGRCRFGNWHRSDLEAAICNGSERRRGIFPDVYSIFVIHRTALIAGGVCHRPQYRQGSDPCLLGNRAEKQMVFDWDTWSRHQLCAA